MTDPIAVTCSPVGKRPVWFLVGLGVVGAVVAAVRMAYRGTIVDVWAWAGLFVALVGVACLNVLAARVSADEHGLRSRTLLRRLSVSWPDVADLRVYVQYGRNQQIRRLSVVLSDGRKRRLPLPWSASLSDLPDFEAKLDALRALHRRYGSPESSHVPVISYRTAGRGSALWAGLCVVLLACAGAAAWFVPAAEAQREAWNSATRCTAATPAAERGECLSTLPAEIARAEGGTGKQSSWLYFTGDRPTGRLEVSQEGAEGFKPGDRVELTFWRHRVRQVVGQDYVWSEHFAGGGDVAAVAAGCLLAAGYPAARVVLRLRGRRLPDDEVLPSALPFAGALAATALWLLPLCYLHPLTPVSSPVAITWAAAGSLATAALLVWAWRATRVRAPGEAGAPREAGGTGNAARSGREDVFLAARFLDHTDYNPNGFGTHIVLGGEAPAVVPHSGPGRFAAKQIPVERLSVKGVRRVRGDDGDAVPRSWHVAELDDHGLPVRLAAAPAVLTRLIGELGLAEAPADTTAPANRQP